MRSLADDLRRRSDEELACLLTARPDLLQPPPADIHALATRAGSATSVTRALDSLDRFTLQVAETLAALAEPASAADVLACFDDELAPAVRAALSTLTELALAWGDDPYRLVRTARDALGPHPGGLGPTCAEQRPRLATLDSASLSALLNEAPDKVRDLLDTLMWGPPVGQVADADRPVSVETARTPVEWLLARDLLVPRGSHAVLLPREVGLALRTLATGRPRVIAEPAWPGVRIDSRVHREPELVARAGGQAAATAVSTVTDLLEMWSASAPAVLRKGGLSVRDLSATAQLLDIDEERAAMWIELAFAAGLLARDGDVDEAWRPTPAYDDWAEETLGRRWAHLATTWWRMTRAPQWVRGMTAPADAPHALSDAADLPLLPPLRAAVVRVLGEVDPGTVVTTAQVVAVLHDRQPRRALAQWEEHVEALLRQCDMLGVTGLGALTPMGSALAGGADTDELAALVDEVVPAPVDHVMIQGDLTAIAPGPLSPMRGQDARRTTPASPRA